MARTVCPWWVGYILILPFRRLSHPPERILGPFVREGMTVLEPGPGMGYFTLELARRVGPRGRVIAVDVQPRMLAALRRRASRAGLQERIETRLVTPASMAVDDLAGTVDVVVALMVVHEMPDAAAFFREAAVVLRPGGCVLFLEPAGHVNPEQWRASLEAARTAGFDISDGPRAWRTMSAVLRKK